MITKGLNYQIDTKNTHLKIMSYFGNNPWGKLENAWVEWNVHTHSPLPPHTQYLWQQIIYFEMANDMLWILPQFKKKKEAKVMLKGLDNLKSKLGRGEKAEISRGMPFS